MSLLDNVKRPTLLLDEHRCRENIRLLAEKARQSGVIFRPHFKSHQSAAIGEWFRREGVTAITVSSVGMAQYFAEAGWNDITIAFPVNLRELEEIDRLAAKFSLNLLVNALETLLVLGDKLKNRVGYFIEIDTGYHRSGILPCNVTLAERLILSPGPGTRLVFQGFLSHFGESYQVFGPDEVGKVYSNGVSALRQLRDAIPTTQHGILSVGDTPTCSMLKEFQGVDEIRPGNFLFYDVMQLGIGACTAGQIALCLAAPVVEVHPARREAVVYAGAIHLAKEGIVRDGEMLYGLVTRLSETGWSEPLQGCAVTGISQEHGIVRLDQATIRTLRPGDLIGILPVHACLTAAAMKGYVTLEGKSISTFTGI